MVSFTRPSSISNVILVHVLVMLYQGRRRNAYRERSVTIQVAPIPCNCSLVWDVQVAKTLAPLATPDLTPEGASSTTMPKVP